MIVLRSTTVPAGVPIAPNQAFVNGSAAMAAYVLATSLRDFYMPNSGIVSIDADYIIARLTTANGDNHDWIVSGNAISDPAEVDAELAALVAGGENNATVDYSGGTNAKPPITQEIVTLTIPDLPVGDPSLSTGFVISTDGFTWQINFAINANFADSQFIGSDTVGVLAIGIMDVPSAEAMAQKITDLWNANITSADGSIAVWNNDKTLTITSSPDGPFAYSFSDQGPPSGVTFVEDQIGAENANVATLEGAGCTVITN